MSYLTINTISLVHEYYFDKNARGLSLEPLRDTQRLMKNYHLLLKNKDSDWYLKQEYRREGRPFVPIEKELKLVFGLRNSDAWFQSKTGITNYRPSRQKIVVLPEGDIEVLDFQIGSYSFVPHESGDYTWHNENDVYSFNLEKDVQASLPVNNFGVCLLTTPSGEQKKVYCGKYDDNFDGLIEVMVNGTESSREIIFPASSLGWEYIIVSKFGRDLNDINLRDETQKLVFEKKESEFKGERAIKFSTVEPVKLSDRYPYYLSLEYRGEIIRKIVPFPSLSDFARCEKDVEKFYLRAFLSI